MFRRHARRRNTDAGWEVWLGREPWERGARQSEDVASEPPGHESSSSPHERLVAAGLVEPPPVVSLVLVTDRCCYVKSVFLKCTKKTRNIPSFLQLDKKKGIKGGNERWKCIGFFNWFTLPVVDEIEGGVKKNRLRGSEEENVKGKKTMLWVKINPIWNNNKQNFGGHSVEDGGRKVGAWGSKEPNFEGVQNVLQKNVLHEGILRILKNSG